MITVDITVVVGRSTDIFTAVNPQIGQQHHQLVSVTHLITKTNVNNYVSVEAFYDKGT